MPDNLSHKLVVSISSRALFDLNESNEVYEKKGIQSYSQFQIAHEKDILKPGYAFSLVQKLLSLNQHGDFVEIILLSRNSTDTGLRIFNSIEHYKLDITRAAFTNGKSPYHYVKAFQSDLFLSANADDVQQALNAGCAAATILSKGQHSHTQQLRVAFDGDAVLFSNESEKLYQEKGMEAFNQNEKLKANTPLPAGPLKQFLVALKKLQSYFPKTHCPIYTALVTARQAPAHERVIRSLRSWNIRIDEALFLGGLSKSEFLKAFDADIFFDDQMSHCQSASSHISTAHVPNQVA